MADNRLYVEEYAAQQLKECISHNTIDPVLFSEYGVKRGLRDKNGKGVLAGLTNISLIQSRKEENGQSVPCDGRLLYRGYDIRDLVKGFLEAHHFGFEEITYLLLFGVLPDESQLAKFQDILTRSNFLPTNFVRDVIMKAPGKDIMNSMTKSVLTLASYDDKISDNSLENVLRQCLSLIATFPSMAVYAYHAYNHYERDAGGLCL